MVDLNAVHDLVSDVKDQLDGMEKNINELVKFKAVHIETHKVIEARQAGFKKTLYGDNGNKGLTYQVAALQANGQVSKKERQTWRNFWIGVLKTLTTAAIIAVTAWLLSVYKVNGAAQTAAGYEITQPAGDVRPQ